jgi:cystathionine gamma-synthase
MAASQAVLQALRPGDHLLLPADVYHGVRYLLDTVFAARGIGYTEVDMGNLDALEAALRPTTRLVWIETPSNPMLQITDIAGAVERAHARNVPVLVDGTWTTPLIHQPLALGADYVLHSVTKYLGCHSDVLGGALVAAREDDLTTELRTIQTAGGGVMDPFSAWLTLRGMRSMAARLRMQCAHAAAVAAFLDDHPRVARVHYPGLPGHPGHAVARKQMRDFGAMLSFEVAGGREAAMAVAARTQVFGRATSLGGTESLVEHRASVEPPGTRTPQSLLRISIGLEHPDDLISDLSQALAG